MASVSDSARIAANIPRFFAYRAFGGFHFGLVIAIWVIFLQRQYGLSLTQVTLIDVAFWVAATLGEVPTGVVADAVSRKASLAVGTLLMSVSLLAWTLLPPVPVVVATYMLLAIGVTFLSGADDALFFESLQVTGRVDEYTRLAGRVHALRLGSAALGNLASGLLATIDLRLPILVAGLMLLAMLGIVVTFREPTSRTGAPGSAWASYGTILRQALGLIRARPTLRYTMAYASLVPVAAVIVETVFLQPQAIAWGVPLAGIGVVVMVVQMANMAGSAWAHRIELRFGTLRVFLAGPVLIGVALVLLAALQALPALSFVAAIGFVTAALRPLVMNRMQREVPDAIRATVFSIQALVFTVVLAVCEPFLGLIADHSGLPAAYVALAAGLSLLFALLFWRSRPVGLQARPTTMLEP